MAPYQVTIAYDGTDFFGYQRQKNRRTVQGEIEKSLTGLGWNGRTIYASGRTDTGVHAEGQVISFDLDWNHCEDELLSALNSVFPVDIAAQSVKIAPVGFHPRFSAKVRQYRYQIYFAEQRQPIMDRYYWRIWPKLDEHCLKKNAESIIGTYDFSAVGRPSKSSGSTIRTVSTCGWKFIESDQAYFRISAESFLYHMVRKIVFLLVQAGKSDAIDFVEILDKRSDLPAGIAPAKGLFLEKVIY